MFECDLIRLWTINGQSAGKTESNFRTLRDYTQDTSRLISDKSDDIVRSSWRHEANTQKVFDDKIKLHITQKVT